MDRKTQRNEQTIRKLGYHPWIVQGTAKVYNIIYFFLIDEFEEPQVCFFDENHPIFDSIADQLNVETELITNSPTLLMGHELNIKPILQEQFYHEAGEATEN
jgi:hypothetical protein